jgi:hypothetical protein
MLSKLSRNTESVPRRKSKRPREGRSKHERARVSTTATHVRNRSVVDRSDDADGSTSCVLQNLLFFRKHSHESAIWNARTLAQAHDATSKHVYLLSLSAADDPVGSSNLRATMNVGKVRRYQQPLLSPSPVSLCLDFHCWWVRHYPSSSSRVTTATTHYTSRFRTLIGYRISDNVAPVYECLSPWFLATSPVRILQCSSR